MKWALFFLLAVPSRADNPVPYYPRSFDKNQAMGAINQNLKDITGRNRDKLAPIVGDQACGTGQPLLGATEKKGYIFGGSCGGPMFVQLNAQTLFQLVNSTPSAVGQVSYCSNCSPPKAVISTGTAMGNYADLVGGTFK